MECPHCHTSYHPDTKYISLQLGNPTYEGYCAQDLLYEFCPACKKVILHFTEMKAGAYETRHLVYPFQVSPPTVPAEVPAQLANDYLEAYQVVPFSPKASAALSRRCLQHLLRDVAKTKKRDLIEQIDEVLPTLPSHLARLIDSVRVVGNFAAHPMKSTHTGVIIDVEPGEAELLLRVLWEAFDFYLVKPAVARRTRDAINQKLGAAGKPPMK